MKRSEMISYIEKALDLYKSTPGPINNSDVATIILDGIEYRKQFDHWEWNWDQESSIEDKINEIWRPG